VYHAATFRGVSGAPVFGVMCDGTVTRLAVHSAGSGVDSQPNQGILFSPVSKWYKFRGGSIIKTSTTRQVKRQPKPVNPSIQFVPPTIEPGETPNLSPIAQRLSDFRVKVLSLKVGDEKFASQALFVTQVFAASREIKDAIDPVNCDRYGKEVRDFVDSFTKEDAATAIRHVTFGLQSTHISLQQLNDAAGFGPSRLADWKKQTSEVKKEAYILSPINSENADVISGIDDALKLPIVVTGARRAACWSVIQRALPWPVYDGAAHECMVHIMESVAARNDENVVQVVVETMRALNETKFKYRPANKHRKDEKEKKTNKK